MHFNFCTDIVIPIISAFIGGGLTMIGVAWTLRNQSKEHREDIKLSIKPLFFYINPLQNYDSTNVGDYVMQSYSGIKTRKAYGIVKNTDNGVLILEKIVSGNFEYIPVRGNIIDKGDIFNLYVDFCENDNYETVVLFVKDVLNNEYKYEIHVELHGDGRMEFTSYKEMYK